MRPLKAHHRHRDRGPDGAIPVRSGRLLASPVMMIGTIVIMKKVRGGRRDG
jgi:hypothetical protein